MRNAADILFDFIGIYGSFFQVTRYAWKSAEKMFRSLVFGALESFLFSFFIWDNRMEAWIAYRYAIFEIKIILIWLYALIRF